MLVLYARCLISDAEETLFHLLAACRLRLLRRRGCVPEPSHSRPGIWASIAAVFRLNRLPCLMLNVLVASLVASYYLSPSMAGTWRMVGEFKVHWSFLFSFVSTVFSAVLLPSTVQWAMGTLPPAHRLRRILCLGLFWGVRGMEIDLFYRAQGWVFGQGHDAGTLAVKVAVDQFVYSVLWAVPTYVIVLRWIDMDWSWTRTRASLNRHFWTHTYPSVLFTNWIVWIPTVALVYSLPGDLQFPLFSVVMCFFILIVTLLARGQAKG